MMKVSVVRVLLGQVNFGFGRRFSSRTLSSGWSRLTSGDRPTSSLSICALRLHSTAAAPKSELKQLGIFEQSTPSDQPYASGQLFFHRKFGYRGVVITAFEVALHDRAEKAENDSQKRRDIQTTIPEQAITGKEQQVSMHPYYLVLVHMDDYKELLQEQMHRQQISYVDSNSGLVAFFDYMDYVLHEDMTPYSALENRPLNNDLFSCFHPVEGRTDQATYSFVPTDQLTEWVTGQSQFWLKPTEIHREITEDVRVSVAPFYLGTAVKDTRFKPEYCWRYIIKVENFKTTAVTLRQRNWKIYMLNGTYDKVSEVLGVVGQNPKLEPGGIFQYSSHVFLKTYRGAQMWGDFKMERENGTMFELAIPCFKLEMPTNSTG